MTDTALSSNYAGPFDPAWTLDRLSRAALARLCREYMVDYSVEVHDAASPRTADRRNDRTGPAGSVIPK